jgi:hypothetical protein
MKWQFHQMLPKVVLVLLQTTWFPIELTEGIGFTVTVAKSRIYGITSATFLRLRYFVVCR